MNYLEILDTYKDDMLAALKESVAINSVETEAVRTTDGEVYPFGRGPQKALEHMLELGSNLGFDTLNDDNYGGHIEFKSEEAKAENFAIVGHLDVVPEGTGWTSDPFTARIADGRIYGRGVSDDKGPLVASLYAMKALKEAGFKPKKNIRLVLGLDEETNKVGMEHYIENVGMPDLGFTPDGEFPLIHGEKGILFFDLSQKLNPGRFKDGLRLTKLQAGTAPNAVPASARAVVATTDSAMYETIKERAEQYSSETGFEVKARKQGSSMAIEAAGVAAHGAQPWLGVNAISILLDFLGRLQFANEEVNEYIAFYNEYIGFNLHGENMGCALEDEPSGKLVWNVGMASFNEEMASVTVNIRYPVTCTEEQVYEGIEQTCEKTRIGIVKTMGEDPIYLSLEHPMVVKLMDAYVEETGDTENKPLVIGGGTYAKLLKNTLAYGGLFPGEPDTMHQADECMSIESFYKMARIYARAIENICG
ncbi:MAG: dipeptidase PepV [Firmicutes bacterium]|nr:dipeptidase PepV [Bacillota bacterium]